MLKTVLLTSFFLLDLHIIVLIIHRGLSLVGWLQQNVKPNNISNTNVHVHLYMFTGTNNFHQLQAIHTIINGYNLIIVWSGTRESLGELI